jgi:hypothetical protein
MWRIYVAENTVTISPECAEELVETGVEELWESAEDVWDSETEELVFDYDWWEHIDYLHEPAIQAVLRRFRVSGVVQFADPQNARMWEYEFIDGVVETREWEMTDDELDKWEEELIADGLADADDEEEDDEDDKEEEDDEDDEDEDDGNIE